jgi:mRNA interferase HigB
MRIISRNRLTAFWEIHPQARFPLEEWYDTLRKARWQNLDEVRRIYPSSDMVKVKSGRSVTVFNIGGNKYRLITAIHFSTHTVYLLHVMTHAEYSKEHWKERY